MGVTSVWLGVGIVMGFGSGGQELRKTRSLEDLLMRHPQVGSE